MAFKLIIAGIGPGSAEYILPKAQKAIQTAHYLAGGRRSLADYAVPGQETHAVTGKLSELKEWIAEAVLNADVVVMVSGDPGYYSLLPWLKREFSHISIEVIPGISSVQAAFSLLAEPWQDAEWLSFHGRRPDAERVAYQKGRKLAFLTDHEQNPAYISSYLIQLGWPEDVPAAAAEHISYENQQVLQMTLSEMTHLEGFGESVMVVMG